jgi:hypothetical protein
MKHSLFLLTCLALVTEAVGAETRSSSAVPQRRVRLDPAIYAAASETPEERKNAPNTPPIMLQRLVVKERSPLPERRPAVEDPKGAFSPLRGGRILQGDVGGLRMEVGIWPTIELFDEEARFKPAQTRIRFDFLRIKW